ncbi:putative Mono-functional DNA-alkylating methyl methanesulfonate N-term-domain-containing protein [Seiridium cardinale]
MALQTNVFENGEWVTRTLEPRELFRQTSSPQQPKPKKQHFVPPTYGLLTKTVIESPVFHWVLPVQLRSARHNDVAFIGDNFIQVCELGRDGQLQDIARKQDLGSRIRNACVLGSPSNYADDSNPEHIKTEEGDLDMLDGQSQLRRVLPPQLLVLVLEGSELVFLHLEEGASGELGFILHGENIPGTPFVSPGFHLAVDPGSRFLALACAEAHFQVWGLESMDVLRAQHAEGLPFKPIVGGLYPRSLTGVIHKMEFLSPGADSLERIILALIIIHKGHSRLHRYEWEFGDDIGTILKEKNIGWPLDPRYQMPLLVIPSTVRESFLMVTETSEAFWATLKNGTLEAEDVDVGEHESTELHIGGSAPLWTAWSRPWRLPEYHLDKDTIWLAREDGILNFLEITAGDGLLTNVILGEVKCKIDTAFACLYDPFADILITGGDSGPGAIWRAEPRQAPRNIGTIPNWSPTVDITSTNLVAGGVLDSKNPRTKARGNAENNLSLKPDRVFVCSGRGQTGSIAEFRYGFEAKVGSELDCGDPIKQCWTMSCPGSNSDAEFYLLVSFPNRSDIWQVNIDSSEVISQGQDEVPYDLSSSTLAAHELDDGTIVQVTSSSVTVITSTDSTRHFPHDLDGSPGAVITNSAIQEDLLALSFYFGSDFRVKTVKVDALNLLQGATYSAEGEVTCVALSRLAEEPVLLVGTWDLGRPILVIYPTQIAPQSSQAAPIRIDITLLYPALHDAHDHDIGLASFEALTSIMSFNDIQGHMLFCLGTRSGEVLILTVNPRDPQDIQGTYSKFGFSAAHVFSMSERSEPASAFVCCDSNLFFMSHLSKKQNKNCFDKTHRVWVTGVASEAGSSPGVDAVSKMRRNLSQAPGRSTLALVSGSAVYISELQDLPKPVLRQFPIGGTPNKVMYHPRLDALVVGLIRDGRPSLRFIDPETGIDLSLPTDSAGNEVEHITGLGKPGSRIVALTHWNFEKDGRTWGYIVVSVCGVDRQGQVLIVTATKEDTRPSEDVPYKIRFQTKLKRSGYPEPVWSIATEAQGLILCSGKTVQYEMLDLEQKKLRKVKEHGLSSPALWMEVVDGQLHVATNHHSLEVVDFLSSPESESMTRLYSDDRAKLSLHCIQGIDTSSKGHHQPITLLSDVYCGVWGMWAPPHGELPLKPIFQSELQASVRRFTRARARPQWTLFNRQTKYGCVRSSVDGADILGLGIDGSLRHFTVVNVDAWRLLRFIQNLALKSSDICPPAVTSFAEAADETDSQGDAMDMDWDPEPRPLPIINRQINGDILQRCLEKRALADLVSQQEHAARLRQLLEAVETGKYTQDLDGFGNMSEYLDLAYDILEYYLAPIL